MLSGQNEVKEIESVLYLADAPCSALSLADVFDNKINPTILQQLVQDINAQPCARITSEYHLQVDAIRTPPADKREFVVEVKRCSSGKITKEDIECIRPRFSEKELFSTVFKNPQWLARISNERIRVFNPEFVSPEQRKREAFAFCLFNKNGMGPSSYVKDDPIMDEKPFKHLVFKLAGL